MCLILSMLLFGPRFIIFFWWVFDSGAWEDAYDTWVWPILGFLIFPWTTLMFVLVAPHGNVDGGDWFWLALAVLFDLASLASNGYQNRQRMPGY